MAINEIEYKDGKSFYITSQLKSTFKQEQKTYFIIHGWNSEPSKFKNLGFQKNGDLGQEIMKKNHGKANIIYVNWSLVAKSQHSISGYSSVVKEIPNVAKALSRVFNDLKINPDETELIGHSLGAHVSGGAASTYFKHLPPNSSKRKIKQIIGLDAAGILMRGGVLIGFSRIGSGRIRKWSADNVIGIHTSNSGGYITPNGGLGWYSPYGHQDIYIYKDNKIMGSSLLNNMKKDHNYAKEFYWNLVNGDQYEYQIIGNQKKAPNNRDIQRHNWFKDNFWPLRNLPGIYVVNVDKKRIASN